MFCPKCGEELADVAGDLTCVSGEMSLSPKMARDLRECFVERTRMPKETTFSFPVGGPWFCPGCGVRAREAAGRIVCPRCSRSLNEFVYHLIELHPHRPDKVREAWREYCQLESRKAPVWPRPSVAITFSDLHIPDFEVERKPLTALAEEPVDHIHGSLSIVLAGRRMPHMGFWGPDDVCLGQWAQELVAISETLSSSPSGEYVFDEGEQGQPAYRFVRQGDEVRVSVVGSATSAGKADPEWQEVACRFEDLRREIERFLMQLHEAIKSHAPPAVDAWWGEWGLPKLE
jgi:hypothetical protein